MTVEVEPELIDTKITDPPVLIEIERIYRASEHDFNSVAYHRSCDQEEDKGVAQDGRLFLISTDHGIVAAYLGSQSGFGNRQGFLADIEDDIVSIHEGELLLHSQSSKGPGI
jgi:hypothetical protein